MAIIVNLTIRRYDLQEDLGLEEPPFKEAAIELVMDMDWEDIKAIIAKVCDKQPDDNKVIKIRRRDEILIPYSFLLDDDEAHRNVFVDVCKIAPEHLEAHAAAVESKLQDLARRLEKAESILPELDYKKQANTEDVVDRLLSKMIFLNRRFDDLLPQQWRPHLSEAAAW